MKRNEKGKKQGTLPFVDNFHVLPLHEGAVLWLASEDDVDEVAGDLLLRLVLVGHVPLLQAQLALPAEQQHKVHHLKRERHTRTDNL